MTIARKAAWAAASSLVVLVLAVTGLAVGGEADTTAPLALARADWLLARSSAPPAVVAVGFAQGEIGGGSAPALTPRAGSGSKVLPMAMSFVLPGLGEAYLGHKRGYALMALDVAGWIGVAHYNRLGNKKRDEYYAFADAHWSQAHLAAAFGADPTYVGSYYFPGVQQYDQLPLWVSAADDRREYYENLGKWDQFIFGWDDFLDPRDNFDDLGPVYDYTDLRDGRVSVNREIYRSMRQDSNRQFTRRDRVLYFNLAMRLFSLFEVAYLEGLLGGGPKDELAVAGHPVRIIAEPDGWHASRFGLAVAY